MMNMFEIQKIGTMLGMEPREGTRAMVIPGRNVMCAYMHTHNK